MAWSSSTRKHSWPGRPAIRDINLFAIYTCVDGDDLHPCAFVTVTVELREIQLVLYVQISTNCAVRTNNPEELNLGVALYPNDILAIPFLKGLRCQG